MCQCMSLCLGVRGCPMGKERNREFTCKFGEFRTNRNTHIYMHTPFNHIQTVSKRTFGYHCVFLCERACELLMEMHAHTYERKKGRWRRTVCAEDARQAAEWYAAYTEAHACQSLWGAAYTEARACQSSWYTACRRTHRRPKRPTS